MRSNLTVESWIIQACNGKIVFINSKIHTFVLFYIMHLIVRNCNFCVTCILHSKILVN